MSRYRPAIDREAFRAPTRARGKKESATVSVVMLRGSWSVAWSISRVVVGRVAVGRRCRWGANDGHRHGSYLRRARRWGPAGRNWYWARPVCCTSAWTVHCLTESRPSPRETSSPFFAVPRASASRRCSSLPFRLPLPLALCLFLRSHSSSSTSAGG